MDLPSLRLRDLLNRRCCSRRRFLPVAKIRVSFTLGGRGPGDDVVDG